MCGIGWFVVSVLCVFLLCMLFCRVMAGETHMLKEYVLTRPPTQNSLNIRV